MNGSASTISSVQNHEGSLALSDSPFVQAASMEAGLMIYSGPTPKASEVVHAVVVEIDGTEIPRDTSQGPVLSTIVRSPDQPSPPEKPQDGFGAG